MNAAQPDLFAQVLRDQGIERVTDNALAWIDRAYQMLVREAQCGMEVSGEDIRVHLCDCGLPAPHHPNAWGALTMMAVRRQLLEDTGRTTQMTLPRSHARRNPVWRFR